MSGQSRALLRRFSGFFSLPLIAALVPFVILPVLARVGGAVGWAAIGIGQSIGTVAALAIGLGWPLRGPSRIAREVGECQTQVMAESLVSRVIASVVVLPIASVLAGFLTPPGTGALAVLTAGAFGCAGLSFSWAAIGRGRPGEIARFETVPKAIAAAASLPVVILTGNLLAYPVLLIAGSLIGYTLYYMSRGALNLSRVAVRAGISAVWDDWASSVADIAAGAYSSTPTSIVGLHAPPPALASFTSADKIYRIALLPVAALSSTFQGWVSEAPPGEVRRRGVVALAAHVVLGVGGSVGILVAAVPASALLFGAQLAATEPMVWGYAVAFICVAVNTSTGRHWLMPMGRSNEVMRSTLAGAIFGVPAMIFASAWMGAQFVSWAFAASELLVTVWQIACLLSVHPGCPSHDLAGLAPTAQEPSVDQVGR